MRFTLPPPSASLTEARDSSHPLAGGVASAILDAIEQCDDSDPLAGAHERIRQALGGESRGAELFSYWASRSPGNPRGEMRYRWELCHRRGVRLPAFAQDESTWRAWRQAEQTLLERDPFEFELKLITPIVLTENIELLADAAGRGDDVARVLRDEALSVVRRDFAMHVQGLEPWQDTFALWCLTRRLRTLGLLHPLAVAIATGYAASVTEEGCLPGLRFPFHKTPLVSASAQLASALVALGLELPLVARLAEFVARAQLPSGGWGDGSSEADVLTTLVAFDLLARIDPSFDTGRPQRYLKSVQQPSGLWGALGPEAPWLSSELVALFIAADQPFAHRFRWPYLPPANRDAKTGLPFFAYFSALAALFAELPGLAQSSVELGFVDLIGFRAFNNAFGQERGDQVLRAFAEALSEIDGTRSIRDGGDEFIVIAAPGRGSLEQELELFRRTWPPRFAYHFGAEVPPVAPRILTGRAAGARLVRAREHLGKGITELKHRESRGTGLLVSAGEIG